MESMESGSPISTRAKSALTQQDHMTRRAARNSRVHFDEDGYIPAQLQEANPILVQVIGEELSKTIGVYLGFLQEEHKYEVKFTIPTAQVGGYLVPLCPPPLTTSTSMSTGPPPSKLSTLGEINVQEVEGDKDSSSMTTVADANPTNSASNGESSSPHRGDSSKPEQQQPSSSSTSSSSQQTTTFAGNLELFGTGREFCQVTGMEWGGVGKAAGLHVDMCVTVPSTNDHHVLEDTFCIKSASVADRFVRVNVAAKIMGKTMGTPTLKDGIKCIGVCPNLADSSDSSEDENEVDMKDNPSSRSQRNDVPHL